MLTLASALWILALIHTRIIIDSVALAEQGDHVLGSVCPSISGGSHGWTVCRVPSFMFWWDALAQNHYQSIDFACVCNSVDAVDRPLILLASQFSVLICVSALEEEKKKLCETL